MKLKYELLFINILTIFLILGIYFFPIVILRIILGLPVLLLFPGFTLLKALFPKKGDLYNVEMFALSFGLSILLVAIIGLILNYTPWGIQLNTVLFADTLFIIISSMVAWFRRRRLPSEERSSLSFGINMKREEPTSTVFKVISVTIIVAILVGLGVLGYKLGTTGSGERFTQFYILGPQGEPKGYPKELQVGEETVVIVGILNHEQENTSYWLEVTINGSINQKTDLILLKHKDKWESEIRFIPTSAGYDQKVEFLLYKDGEEKPYHKLYLWIDVMPIE